MARIRSTAEPRFGACATRAMARNTWSTSSPLGRQKRRQMNFSDWNEALPFALAVGRAFARRQPFQLDVESVVMMALWKAQTRGAVFSRAYVALRVRGALQDEMRTLAEGQRRNYQNSANFKDIDDYADR